LSMITTLANLVSAIWRSLSLLNSLNIHHPMLWFMMKILIKEASSTTFLITKDANCELSPLDHIYLLVLKSNPWMPGVTLRPNYINASANLPSRH
jgi:hypothetical protein